MPNIRKNFNNPLEAGRYFLDLKLRRGMSVKDIAAKCDKSEPAVYKYISLAEAPKPVLKAIEDGLIPATRVIRIIDTQKKENPTLSLWELVQMDIKQRQRNETIMQSQGITKMTMKSRINAFTLQIEGNRNKKAKLLLEFAKKLNEGAPVSELVDMVYLK